MLINVSVILAFASITEGSTLVLLLHTSTDPNQFSNGYYCQSSFSDLSVYPHRLAPIYGPELLTQLLLSFVGWQHCFSSNALNPLAEKKIIGNCCESSRRYIGAHSSWLRHQLPLVTEYLMLTFFVLWNPQQWMPILQSSQLMHKSTMTKCLLSPLEHWLS